MRIRANGVTLQVEEHGPADGPPLVLIRGLGTQLIHWPDALIGGFSAAGFRTIIFDNRDSGLSSRCPVEGVVDHADAILAAIARGLQPKAAYGLDDMAADVVGLLDALAIGRAHVFGISMGGGIAQILAIDHPERLLSATLVMTAARPGGFSRAERLLAHPQTRAQAIARWLKGHRQWGSPGYPMSEAEIRAEAGRAWDRAADAAAENRQVLAIAISGDRRRELMGVELPCLVIHGAEDTLVPVGAAREIAALIPNARLHVIAGMSHVITPRLSPKIVALVADFIRSQPS